MVSTLPGVLEEKSLPRGLGGAGGLLSAARLAELAHAVLDCVELVLVPVLGPPHHLQPPRQPVPLLLYRLHPLQLHIQPSAERGGPATHQSVVNPILQGVAAGLAAARLPPAGAGLPGSAPCTAHLQLSVRRGPAVRVEAGRGPGRAGAVQLGREGEGGAGGDGSALPAELGGPPACRLLWLGVPVLPVQAGLQQAGAALTLDSDWVRSAWLRSRQIFSPAQNRSKVRRLSAVATFLQSVTSRTGRGAAGTYLRHSITPFVSSPPDPPCSSLSRRHHCSISDKETKNKNRKIFRTFHNNSKNFIELTATRLIVVQNIEERSHGGDELWREAVQRAGLGVGQPGPAPARHHHHRVGQPGHWPAPRPGRIPVETR